MDATVARIRRTIEHIEANLFRPLSLAEFAAPSGLSVYHVHRLFTAVFGYSIKGYIRRRRLTEAAALLRSTDRGVLEIAMAAQFESQASFTRAFKAFFGVPPGRYRDGDARHWYPGLSPATIQSLEHLRAPTFERSPTRRALEHAVEVHGFAAPVDLEAELRILEIWTEILSRLDPATAGDAMGWGVALPSHPGIELRPEESLVYLAGADRVTPSPFLEPPPYRCTIPPGEYVVFEHRGAPDSVPATLDWIWASWLPKSGLEKSTRPDFERFRLGDLVRGQPAIELWLSVEP